MPKSLVLLTAGDNTTVNLPNTAQECCTTWRHDRLFPAGVTLHRMMHLPREMARDIGIMAHLSSDHIETISLSLLIDKRIQNITTVSSFIAGGTDCIPPNFHEIPKLLDTQLFYGNLLVILTIDGTTILPFDINQYHQILKNQYPTNQSSFNNTNNNYSFFSITPTSEQATTSDPMSISSGGDCGDDDEEYFFDDDEMQIESMNISESDDEDEESSTPISLSSGRSGLNGPAGKRQKFLDICLKSSSRTPASLPRPIRPVF